MPTNWLSNVFNFNVEYKEIPRPGNKPYIPLAPNGVGVLHTTEGPRRTERSAAPQRLRPLKEIKSCQ